MTTIRMGWTRPVVEDEYEIKLRVGRGYPGRGPDMNGPGEPPEPPEVEVLAVADYEGNDRPDLIEEAAADIDRWYADACEAAQDKIDALYEDAMERRAEP